LVLLVLELSVSEQLVRAGTVGSCWTVGAKGAVGFEKSVGAVGVGAGGVLAASAGKVGAGKVGAGNVGAGDVGEIGSVGVY
jgi:hypothetical protein